MYCSSPCYMWSCRRKKKRPLNLAPKIRRRGIRAAGGGRRRRRVTVPVSAVACARASEWAPIFAHARLRPFIGLLRRLWRLQQQLPNRPSEAAYMSRKAARLQLCSKSFWWSRVLSRQARKLSSVTFWVSRWIKHSSVLSFISTCVGIYETC